jgi:hypothetical protein
LLIDAGEPMVVAGALAPRDVAPYAVRVEGEDIEVEF